MIDCKDVNEDIVAWDQM